MTFKSPFQPQLFHDSIYTDYDLFLALLTVVKQMVHSFILIQHFDPSFWHARKWDQSVILNSLKVRAVATLRKQKKEYLHKDASSSSL